jgi:hypothetical protein
MGDGGKRGRQGSKSKNFFFVNKKEAKKTLIYLYRAGETAWSPVSKSFLRAFFQKSAAFFSSIPPRAGVCAAQ